MSKYGPWLRYHVRLPNGRDWPLAFASKSKACEAAERCGGWVEDMFKPCGYCQYKTVADYRRHQNE